MITREIKAFLVVGASTVVIDFCTYSLLMLGVDQSVTLAKATGFIAGTVFAYLANKKWTFRNSRSGGTLWRFAIIYTSTLGVNVGINDLMLYLLGSGSVAVSVAFLMATGSSAALNFFGMKFFVFK